MKKSIQRLLYLIIFTTIFYSKDDIVIYYGNKALSKQAKYNMIEVTTDRIIITQDKIEFTDLNINKEINMDEYRKLNKIIQNTINKKKITSCYNITNKNNSLITRVPSKIVNKMNTIIKYNEKNYCIVGKNELLDYLGYKYSLNIKWEDDPLDIDKILKYGKIELGYGRQEISAEQFSYHRREEIETKIIIYKGKIEVESLISKKFQVSQLSENEYTDFVNLLHETLKEEKFVICDGIINPLSTIQTEAEILKPITTIVYLNNKEYCLLGKNKLLENLNNKYNLNIIW